MQLNEWKLLAANLQREKDRLRQALKTIATQCSDTRAGAIAIEALVPLPARHSGRRLRRLPPELAAAVSPTPAGTRAIALPGGSIAIVDEADFEKLSKYRWLLSRGYVVRASRGSVDDLGYLRGSQVPMHRQILGLRNGDPDQGDHIDGDRLNNQRANLRKCTQTQNSQNTGSRGGTSRYKGVSYEGGYARPWSTRLRGKIIGRFVSEDEAARAYDAAAIQAYGEFARTNFSGVDGVRGVALRSPSS